MRKQIIVVLISVLFLSCKKEKKVEAPTIEVKSTVVSNFLKNINSLKEVKKPITQFQDEVMRIAAKKEDITKDNINEILKTAENYTSLVIVVSNHTIVKINDVKNCKTSGSWAACMPYAKGFIKKGQLVYKEDYCNNIIGRPDSQKRTAYFFN